MYVMVNKNQLSSNIAICDEAILTLKEERKKLSTLIGIIGEIWKGNDYDAFALKMSYFVEDLKAFENQIVSYDKFVSGYIKTKNVLDKHYKNRKIKIE